MKYSKKGEIVKDHCHWKLRALWIKSQSTQCLSASCYVTGTLNHVGMATLNKVILLLHITLVYPAAICKFWVSWYVPQKLFSTFHNRGVWKNWFIPSTRFTRHTSFLPIIASVDIFTWIILSLVLSDRMCWCIFQLTQVNL